MWFLLFLNILCLVFLCFCLLDAVCFLSFWFVMELLSFSVVPYFIFWSEGLSRRCLLQYVVVLLFSSFFLVVGLLSHDCRGIFLSLGVLLKLGVFPFLFWLYDVVIYANWVVVWIISGFLKVPFLLIFYIRGVDVNELVCLMCFLSFVVLSISFWKVSFSWRHCWCHMMLSGSAGLAVVSLFCSFSCVFYLFFIYLVWCSFVLWLFSILDVWGFGGLGGLLYLFFLVSLPFSLAVLYKLALGVSVMFCSFFVFCSWSVYTVSEQLFLVFMLAGVTRIRSFVSLVSSV